MANAKKKGGLYYVNGKAVDAHGNEIVDAPPKPADTDPKDQPGALDAPSAEERMGRAIATALREGTVPLATPAIGAVPSAKNKAANKAE